MWLNPNGGEGQAMVPEEDAFVVRDVLDAVWASRRVADFAERCGLGRRAAAELAVVASELVTNAVKFAGRGVVQLARIDGVTPGVQIVVQDPGPGIADPELALLDGYSEGAMRTPDDDPRGRRGLGSGLSAARRLSDDLQIEAPATGGTRVIARKFLAA